MKKLSVRLPLPTLYASVWRMMRCPPYPRRVQLPEGHCNAFHLLYQLCPAAAPESPHAPCRVCVFEGLFSLVDRPYAVEGAPTLFHRVAELRYEHRQRFRVAVEAG